MDESLLTYIIVFLVVLIPSILLNAVIGEKEASKNGGREVETSFGVPAIYRLFSLPIKLFSELGLGKLMASVRNEKNAYWENKLVLANVGIPIHTIYSAQMFMAILFGCISFLFCIMALSERQWSIYALFIGLWMGWIYPALEIEKLADRRQTEIIRGLPFAIDLIGSAMRSGLDFGAAVRYYVSLGFESPLTVEFGIMLRQMELGKTRIEALEMMATRIQSKDFSSFVGAVVHGTQVGASIAETMDIQGEEMRRSRFHLAERKAARAPSLMILPMALFIMPSVFIMIFTPVFLKVQSSGMSGMFK